MQKPLVIIGSGVAGYTLAQEFRRLLPEHPLVMITRNGGEWYYKPSLSNCFYFHRDSSEWAAASAEDMADYLNITFFTDTEVTRIDPHKQCVIFENQTLEYAHLALALGSQPKSLSFSKFPIFQMNELAHYQMLRQELLNKNKVVILGSGLVGCEFANDIAVGGYEVQVVSQDHYPLEHLLPKAVGAYLQKSLENLGIRWQFQAKYEDFLKTLDPSDTLVLATLGLQAEIGLAKAAGLETDTKIIVNRYLETNLPNIYALGECAEIREHHHRSNSPPQLSAQALAHTLAGERTAVTVPSKRYLKVKTTSAPLILSGKIAPRSNEWKIEVQEEGLHCTLHENGEYTGLILTGKNVEKFQEFPMPEGR